MRSSGVVGKCYADLEAEVGVVAVAVGHAFQDFELVVAAFEDAGGQRISLVAEDALEVSLEERDEALLRGELTGPGASAPLRPPA